MLLSSSTTAVVQPPSAAYAAYRPHQRSATRCRASTPPPPCNYHTQGGSATCLGGTTHHWQQPRPRKTFNLAFAQRAELRRSVTAEETHSGGGDLSFLLDANGNILSESDENEQPAGSSTATTTTRDENGNYWSAAAKFQETPRTTSTSVGTPRSPTPPVDHADQHHNIRQSTSSNRQKSGRFTQDEAANRIIQWWRQYKGREAQDLGRLIDVLHYVRQAAAISIQRRWRGVLTRRCYQQERSGKLKIVFWDDAVFGQESESAKSKHQVVVRGGFTVPPWERAVKMDYCPVRKLYIAFIPQAPATTSTGSCPRRDESCPPLFYYPCKFQVDDKHSHQQTCPRFYPTVLDAMGWENSAVSIETRQRWICR